MSAKIKEATIKKATQKGKKLQAKLLFENGQQKTVAFGAQGMSDFTQHKDPERRQRYRDRHRNDKINDPSTAGFWSWNLLWGEKPSLIGSAKDIQNRKKIKVSLKV